MNAISSRRHEVTIGAAYSRAGAEVLLPRADQPPRPPAGVFDDVQEQDGSRVVETGEGTYAYIAAKQVGRAPDDWLMVLGQPFDTAFAQRLRDDTGGIDVVLLIDGKLVGASLATLDRDTFDSGRDGGTLPAETIERDVVGRQYWLRYKVTATPGPYWGKTAVVGVMVPEPLAVLDNRLLRSRTISAVLLLLLVTAMAWFVSRMLTRPLSALTGTAARIAAGDLDAQFEAARNDEVGLLSRTLEQMRRGLQEQLDVIRRQTNALRTAARRIVGAQDEARRRIAGDLHDGVQQQLVMLRMHLGVARARLQSDPDRADEVFGELGEETDAILGRLRETAQGIYPSILRDRGLQGALFSLAGRAETTVDVTARPDPLPRLDRDVEANAYFLVAEAVTNALKHADPARITIEVACSATTLQILVADDGRGFDTGSIRSQGGLSNLRDRAAAIGGHVTVRSRTGGGTTVKATVPLTSVGALEEEEDGGDPAVDVDLVPEPDLAEDGVGVLLDRPLRDDEVAGDGGVPLARRHH
jgi:signal transduction histidine kinase